MKKTSFITAELAGRRGGFTIVELMITLAVVAVVAALAAPNMRSFILNNRLTSTNNELLRSIQTARAEATKRQQNVVLCTSADPTAAPTATAPSCSKTGIKGWIVFQDSNGDWDRSGATEELIETHTFESDAMYLVADGSKRVSFAATGFANPSGTTPATQTRTSRIVMCDDRGNTTVSGQSTARGISIAQTGRPSFTRNTADISNYLSTIVSLCPP